MAERLPLYTELPAHSCTVALEGVQYEVRFVYRERTASWYFDLHDEQGEPIVLGRRLSPGWSPALGVTSGPPGAFYVFGKDPYDRHELELWYLSAAELEAALPDESDLPPVALE